MEVVRGLIVEMRQRLAEKQFDLQQELAATNERIDRINMDIAAQQWQESLEGLDP